MSSSILTASHKYAAGSLFGMALHQTQIHQTNPLASFYYEEMISSSSGSVSRDVYSDLLRPIFRFLDIEDKPWPGLKETVGTSSTEQHVGSFLRLLAEENGDTSKEVKDQERALSKAVDAMSSTIETSVDFESKKEKHREYEHECREKFSTAETEKQSQSEVERKGLEDHLDKKGMPSSVEQAPIGPSSKCDEKPFKEISMLGYQRKVAVLYELLSACLALTPEANENATRRRQGYDARHRVALRLLATWFDVKWIKMVVFPVDNISCFFCYMKLMLTPSNMLLATPFTMHVVV